MPRVDPLRELGRTLLVLGGLLVVVGALLYFGGKLPLRLGRLPGDVVHRGEHTTFYFPIVTCLILLLRLALLSLFFGQFREYPRFFVYFACFLKELFFTFSTLNAP